MWLTRFSIQRPIIVAIVFIALAAYGAFAFFNIGRSLNPNVTFPVIVVSANYPGASPAEMERLIIKPIEDQIDGIDNLDQLSATAQEGIATVVVQFKIDTNLDFAAIDVQRRVDTARVFMPTDLDPPLVDKSEGSQQAPILSLALSSKSLSPTGLSDLVSDRIVPDLRHIPNVQGVTVKGQVKREFHVLPDPLRLIATGATLNDIFAAIQQNNANVPGGRLDSPVAESTVSIHADIVRASDMLGISLPVPGGTEKSLRVGDVANAEDGHVEQRIVSKFRGSPTVILDLNRVITADEINSTKIARQQIKLLAARYPAVTFEEVVAPADYTQRSLDGVLQNLVEGIILTAVVLMLFLHAWRNAVVVMIAIPSSLLSTFIVMKAMHFTLDGVSLMGLSLIIGILVDDSIVVLENITRHRDLGQSPQDAALSGRSEIGGAAIAITLVDVVVFLPIAFLSGIVGKFMLEFGVVVVVATLFSLFVSFTLTPVLAAGWSVVKRSAGPPKALAWFQTGFEAFTIWYRDRALPYALAHRWLTATICAMLLLNASSIAASASTAMLILDAAAIGVALVWLATGRFITGFGARLSSRTIDGIRLAARIAFVAAAVALAAGFVAGTTLDRSLFAIAGAGAVLGALGVVLAGIRHLLAQRPRIDRGATFGASAAILAIAASIALLAALNLGISSEFIPSTDSGSIRMTLSYPTDTPIARTIAAVDRVEAAILTIPSVHGTITTVGMKPSGYGETIGGNVAQMRVVLDREHRREENDVVRKIRTFEPLAPGAVLTVAGEGGGGSGGDPIFYTLSGPEDRTGIVANRLADFIRSLPGTVNVQTGAETEGNRLNIFIDRSRCALLGVSPGAAATAARIAIGGAVATRVRTQGGLVDVRVQLPHDARNALGDIQTVKVRANDGSMYRLADVATFSYAKAPTKVERLDRQRIARVTGGFDPAVTKLGDVDGKIAAWISQPGNLDGVQLKANGDSQFFQETIQSMGIALGTSFLLVYILLVVLYGSFLTPFVIMFSVPLALVGAFYGLAITHETFNLFSLIGLIMLLGLVAKNGILLVDYANTQRRRGLRVLEAMRVAAGIRLRPIVMTTASMVFGMLPLALGLAEGAEFRRSMGTVLIGGLLSSLILTLFLVPVVYAWVAGTIERRADRRAFAAELEADERFLVPTP